MFISLTYFDRIWKNWKTTKKATCTHLWIQPYGQYHNKEQNSPEIWQRKFRYDFRISNID